MRSVFIGERAVVSIPSTIVFPGRRRDHRRNPRLKPSAHCKRRVGTSAVAAGAWAEHKPSGDPPQGSRDLALASPDRSPSPSRATRLLGVAEMKMNTAIHGAFRRDLTRFISGTAPTCGASEPHDIDHHDSSPSPRLAHRHLAGRGPHWCDVFRRRLRGGLDVR